MAHEICPILLATIPAMVGPDMARCRLEDCMLFCQEERKPKGAGNCAIFKIALELSAITI